MPFFKRGDLIKKIFIVFLTILIMCACFVIPVVAAVPETFMDQDNLLYAFDYSPRPFYSSPGVNEGQQSFIYLTDKLKPNTDYTFISTMGSDRFYCGPAVLDENGAAIIYGYNSSNLLNSNVSKYSSGMTFSNDNMGHIVIDGLKYGANSNNIVSLDIRLDPGTYTFSFHYYSGSFSRDTPVYLYFFLDSGESFCLTVSEATELTSVTFTLTEDIVITSLRLDIYNDNVVFDNYTFGLMLEEGNTASSFVPYWSEYFYNDNFTTVYNFTTPSSFSNYYVLGIGDTLREDKSQLFSTITLGGSANEFYLLEGKYTVDQINEALKEQSYNDGYDSGYDQGYKEGEHDGMEADSTFANMIMTTLSAPFTIIANSLDFDLFGINIYTLLKVIVTIMLVLFVVSKVKGGSG